MRLYTAPDHGWSVTSRRRSPRPAGVVTAIDVAESSHVRLVVDVTCSASDAGHADDLRAVVAELRGRGSHGQRPHVPAAPRRQDRGQLKNCAAHARRPVDGVHPGVGRVSMALAEEPRDIARLTVKGNSVAVVTDGSAVLGWQHRPRRRAPPVMEGKAALFKRFADIDAWPICLASQDTDEIVKAVEMIAPGFGASTWGHRRPRLLRDRAAAARAPRHPGLPRRPARHRDRGARRASPTRCAWWAKDLAGVRIVVSGGVRRGPRSSRCCSRPG